MFARILIPFEGSAVSSKSIKRGVEFAKSLGARITALHVSPTFRQLMDEGYLLPDMTFTEERMGNHDG